MVSKMSINEVKQSLKNSGRHLSMDAPLKEGEKSTLYDIYKTNDLPNADKELSKQSLRIEISRALQTLSPREANVVRLFYGIGSRNSMSLNEIGQTFDLTRERVRQIKEKAIRRLRHKSRSTVLKTYLG